LIRSFLSLQQIREHHDKMLLYLNDIQNAWLIAENRTFLLLTVKKMSVDVKFENERQTAGPPHLVDDFVIKQSHTGITWNIEVLSDGLEHLGFVRIPRLHCERRNKWSMMHPYIMLTGAQVRTWWPSIRNNC